MARLILCADDFALSHATSRIISELAGHGQINATSCMAALPGWDRDAALLTGLPAPFQAGLHLVLTGERPVTPMPRFAPESRLPAIDPLGRAAGRGELPLDEIAAEIRAQFDRFIDVLGRPPAFVDGHQHAHALPGIREIVLNETARRAPHAWVRTCTDRIGAIVARPFRGKALASALHSRGLRKAAARHGLQCNDGFAGHYGFAGDYRALFPKFLRHPGWAHLVMCHPGASEAGDAIGPARQVEAAALRTLPVRELAHEHRLVFAT